MRHFIIPVAIIVLVILSLSRNAIWRDDGTLWRDTIAKSPGKWRTYNELGLHALSAQKPDLAMRYFLRAVQAGPNEFTVYCNLGITFEQLNDYEKALKMYEHAIFLNSQDPVPYYNTGMIYFSRLKEPERALGWFLQARDRNPDEPDVHLYLGYIYQGKNDNLTAKNEFLLHQKLK